MWNKKEEGMKIFKRKWENDQENDVLGYTNRDQ